MNAWLATNRWYRHWVKFKIRLKTEALSAEDRELVSRSAVMAQAEYIMSLAEEQLAR